MISAQTLLDESYKSLQQSVYSVFLIGDAQARIPVYFKITQTTPTYE